MRSNEDGKILIDILIAMGVVLLISTIVMKAKLKTKLIDDHVFAKGSAEYQVESFTHNLGQFTLSQLPRLCSEQALIGSTIDFSGSKAVISSSPDLSVKIPDAQNARVRCQNPKFSRTGVFYFCLDIPANPRVPEHSFLGAPFNVVELAIRVVDRWQNPIDCQKFLSSQSKADLGLQIYYRLYWNSRSKPQTLHSKSGFHYAIP